MFHWQYLNVLLITISVLLGAAALFFGAYFLYGYYINRKLQDHINEKPEGRLKIRLPQISVVLLVFVLLTTFVLGGYYTGVIQQSRKHKLYARIGYLRAENAQYVPDIFKLPKAFGGEADATEISGTEYENFESMNTNVTLDNYAGLVEMLGTIESHYDPNFTVLTLKEEIKTLFQNITVFDRWVKIKNETLSEIGEYCVSYDAETYHMTVLRRRSFSPWVWDAASKQARPISHEVLYKLDYAYDESGTETFECEIFSVLRVDGKDHIRQYQYIKNVKDTSFTKYIIAPLTVLKGEPGYEPLYEIDSDNPYGAECRFVQVDYSDTSNTMLFVNQTFASAHNDMPDVTSVKLYAGTEAELTLYHTVFSKDISKHQDLKKDIFYDGEFNDLMKMYREQDDNIRSELYGPRSGLVKLPPDDIPQNEITHQEREILYKSVGGIAVMNNFEGVGKSLGTEGQKDKLKGAYGYLNESLNMLAKSTGATIPMPAAPVSDNTDHCAFENALQEALGWIAKNAVESSYLGKQYRNILKAADRYVLI